MMVVLLILFLSPSLLITLRQHGGYLASQYQVSIEQRLNRKVS